MTRLSPALAACAALLITASCTRPWPFLADRYSKIPADARKGTPATDPFPPILLSSDYEDPVPMPGPINSAGAEDSPFISPDGGEFFFFFTPDVRVPVERQLEDSVTGIWHSWRSGSTWTEPDRVVLSDGPSLDGCEQLVGDTLWFASVRAGNIADIDVYTAVRRGAEWVNVRDAGAQLNRDYRVGEFHLTSDHETLYFGRPDSSGNSDLWYAARSAGGWSAPVRLGPAINDGYNQLQPWVSSDRTQLWYTGWNANYLGPCVYRCRRDSAGAWSAPELVVARFAGEPTLDGSGNLYFTHHFYTGGDSSRMLEADIYYCRRR